MSSPGIAATGPTWEARCGGDPLDHSGEGRLLERQGRMTAPPGDRGQLEFLQQVQRIFDEGEFVATHGSRIAACSIGPRARQLSATRKG